MSRWARSKRLAHRIAFGRHGLRAGWSVILSIAIFWGIGFVSTPVARHLILAMKDSSVNLMAHQTVGYLLFAARIAVTIFVMAKIERRKFLDFGFRGDARVIRLISGLIAGFTSISLLVLLLWKLDLLQISGPTLHMTTLFAYALAWGGFMVIVAFTEESIFRGYAQFTLGRSLGFGWTALLLSAAFGALHGGNPGETPVGRYVAMAVGLMLSLSVWYTGSLWWAMGFHAAWDWGESYFYGTPDSGGVSVGRLFTATAQGNPILSGGTTGPEGSALSFGLVVLLMALMWLWWGRRTRSPFSGNAWRPARS